MIWLRNNVSFVKRSKYDNDRRIVASIYTSDLCFFFNKGNAANIKCVYHKWNVRLASGRCTIRDEIYHIVFFEPISMCCNMFSVLWKYFQNNLCVFGLSSYFEMTKHKKSLPLLEKKLSSLILVHTNKNITFISAIPWAAFQNTRAPCKLVIELWCLLLYRPESRCSPIMSASWPTT